MDEQRAFDGIKVLDFTQGIAGPHSRCCWRNTART